MRVLLAERDVHSAHAKMTVLEQAGLLVDLCNRGDDAFEMARHFDYDVVLLNEDLPGLRGLEVLRQMRRLRCELSVVILTADLDPRLKTEAFGLGADDVLTLPMDLAELVSRLHAIIRRSCELINSVVSLRDLKVDFNSMEVAFAGRPICLTRKEFSVLQLLILRRGTVLNKDAFMNHLYSGMDEPEMTIVDVLVCKLRRKMQMAGASNFIVTVRGCGYMLPHCTAEMLSTPTRQQTAMARSGHLAQP